MSVCGLMTTHHWRYEVRQRGEQYQACQYFNGALLKCVTLDTEELARAKCKEWAGDHDS